MGLWRYWYRAYGNTLSGYSLSQKSRMQVRPYRTWTRRRKPTGLSRVWANALPMIINDIEGRNLLDSLIGKIWWICVRRRVLVSHGLPQEYLGSWFARVGCGGLWNNAICETKIVVICVLGGDGGDGWKNRLLLGGYCCFWEKFARFWDVILSIWKRNRV